MDSASPRDRGASSSRPDATQRGTTGSQLDVLARLALWQAALDYDHGTGHGRVLSCGGAERDDRPPG
jgi:Xaa-Pro aminopeptidase